MATDDIAKQTKTAYENYKKIKGIVDLGYFLEEYIVEGGIVTKDVTHNNMIDVTEIVVSLDDDVTHRDATSFTTKVANTTYYLDYMASGDFNWDTAHYSGSYLPVAQVTTDANKNVLVITDMRGTVGGVRFKYNVSFGSSSLADIGNIDDLETIDKTNLVAAINEKINVAKSALFYSGAVEDVATMPINALAQSRIAIQTRNELRIVYLGDSITEGGDILNDEEKYANRVTQIIRNALPTVAVTATNYALGGRNLYLATSPTYLATATEPADVNDGFFRSWSTIGVSWLDHVKASRPDVIVLAFGMNDASAIGADAVYAFYLDYFKSLVTTWPTVPDIIIVPTFVQSADHGGTAQKQRITQTLARATRYYGIDSGYVVADVNRLYNILINGIEDVTRIGRAELNFEGYPSAWSADTSSFTLNAGVLTPINGVTNKKVGRGFNFYNGSIEMTFKQSEDGYDGDLEVVYRNDSDFGSMSVFVFGGESGFVQINYHAGVIATSGTVNIPLNVNHAFKLVVNGSKHQVYINGTLVLTATSYRCQHNGGILIGGSGTPPIVSNLKLSAMDQIAVTPLYTEADLLGPFDSSEGGNAFNHPNGLGHALMYLPAFNGVAKALGNIPSNEVTKTKSTKTYYVKPTGNDADDGLSSNTAVADARFIIGRLPDRIDHDIIINVAAGTYPSALLLPGFQGRGSVTLQGGSSKADSANFLLPNIFVKNCSIPIIVNGFRATDAAAASAFSADQSSSVNFTNCTAVASALSKYGFLYVRSKGKITTCDASNKFVGISAKDLTELYSDTNGGTSNTTGLESTGAARVITNSTSQPAGTTATAKSEGGTIDGV